MKTIHRDIVSALIISKDNKLLMGMKYSASGGVYADCWHLPGGGIENGEEMLTAVKREILEETGINTFDSEIVLADNQGQGITEKILKEAGEKVLCNMKFNVYKVMLNIDSVMVVIHPNDDLEKLIWADLSQLSKYKLTPPSISLFKRLGYMSDIDKV